MNREAMQRESVRITVHEAVILKVLRHMSDRLIVRPEAPPNPERDELRKAARKFSNAFNEFRTDIAAYRGKMTRDMDDATRLSDILQQEWEKEAEVLLEKLDDVREAINR